MNRNYVILKSLCECINDYTHRVKICSKCAICMAFSVMYAEATVSMYLWGNSWWEIDVSKNEFVCLFNKLYIKKYHNLCNSSFRTYFLLIPNLPPYDIIKILLFSALEKYLKYEEIQRISSRDLI